MTDGLDTVRVDKWLWAVRICKTRSIATDLCDRGRVKVDGSPSKPSRKLRPGQLVAVKKDGLQREFKVLKCIDKRVGAPLADECKEEITPVEELQRVASIRKGGVPRRPKGSGRPTKRDRRKINELYS